MKTKENMRFVKLGITLLVTIILALIFFFLMYRIDQVRLFLGKMRGITAPFVYGGVMAYLLNPLCKKIEKWLSQVIHSRKTAEMLSIILSVILAVLVISSVVMLVLPSVYESIIKLFTELPEQVRQMSNQVESWLGHFPTVQKAWADFWKSIDHMFNSWVNESFLPNLQNMLPIIMVHLSNFFDVFKNFGIGLIIAFYFLTMRRRLLSQCKLILRSLFNEKWVALIEEEVHYADRCFNGFIVGKLIDSTIIGLICFCGCWFLGYDAFVLVALIVGITNMIPFFGPYIGAVPSAIILFLESPVHAFTFLIFIFILQQFDGNILGPKILSDSIGLSGFWVLFAILFFGGIWGIAGMLVGVPLFAVIYDIVRKIIYASLNRKDQSQLVEEYQETFHKKSA